MMTAAEHIAAAEKALKRAQEPQTSSSLADHLLRITEMHTRLAVAIQAETQQVRDGG